MRRIRAMTPSSRLNSSPSGSITPAASHLPGGHLEQLVGLGREHRRIGRGDQRLARRGRRGPRGCAAARGRAPRARRRGGAAAGRRGGRRSAPPRRAGARAPRAAARPASRSCAARGRRRRATMSSRCGPSPVTPRSRSRSSRASSAATVGGSPVVAKLGVREARARRHARRTAREQRERFLARGDELASRARRPAPSTAPARHGYE